MPILVGHGDRIILPSGRASSLKRPSTAWGNYGSGSQTMLDGNPVSYRELATSQPWVAIAVNGIARQISRLPLKVYRRTGDDSRERDRESFFARALARPGRRRSAANFKYSVATGLLVDGNHCEELVTIAGEPALRKLDWRWLIPYVLEGEVVAWEYAPPLGERRPIDVNDVIHYRWDVENGLGVSPLKSLGISLRSEDASQTWSEANFKNGTRMGVAVIVDKDVKGMGQPERESMREEIEGRYSGPENAGRPLILGGGVSDVKEIGSQTPVEASLIQQRKLNREEILGVYNWPPPIAGDLEHGTFSNVAELAKIVFRIVLPPWTGLMQEETTIQMIAPQADDTYAEFDYGGVLAGEPRERYAAYNQGLVNGVLTLNDVRAMENLPSFDVAGADDPIVNANNRAPLSQVVAAAAGDPEPEPEPDPVEED